MDGEKFGDSTIIVTEILPPYGRLNDKKTGLDALANASRPVDQFVKTHRPMRQRVFIKTSRTFSKSSSSF